MTSAAPQIDARVAPVGVSLAAQLSLYDSSQWEEFVTEWMEGFEPRYQHAERLAGPGDKGRDVVGYHSAPGPKATWDNYQCKHYAAPLQPSDIWLELGKMCYFSWKGDFSPPSKYRFVAPKEVSPKLKEMLRHPEKIREGLKANWQGHCQKNITATEEVKLEGNLLAYVDAYDFSTIGYEPLQSVLTQHARTPFWSERFKAALPARPPALDPPPDVASQEARYVEQLLDAYSDKESAEIRSMAQLSAYAAHERHFHRSRRWFYSAESLNRFTRDHLRPGAFENLKKQVLDGVIDTAEGNFGNSYERLIATTDRAASLAIAHNELSQLAEVGDKKGVCHHLANEDKLKWRQS